jgi:hypothetical protein
VEGLAAALRSYGHMDPSSLRSKGGEAYRYLRSFHDIGPFRQAYRALIDTALASVGGDGGGP